MELHPECDRQHTDDVSAATLLRERLKKFEDDFICHCPAVASVTFTFVGALAALAVWNWLF